MRLLIILLLFNYALFSKVDISFSHTNIVHGTTFAIIFDSDKKMSFSPNVIFMNKTYQMFSIDASLKRYEVFLPVSYYAKKQKENVQVKYIKNNKTIKKNFSIKIIDGKYKQNEIITVPKGKVTLSKKNKTKSSNEYKKVYKYVYSKIDTKNYINNSTFEMPMNSKITSAYGNARIYNGKTKSYHTGTDFRAKVGSPIYAANDGIVALTMNRFYLGNVVYINHGRGAYTYYCHMSEFKVKDNQKIKKGDLIGYSGVSGRITGPHLHYANRLYNVTVDPLQFASLHNEILLKYHKR